MKNVFLVAVIVVMACLPAYAGNGSHQEMCKKFYKKTKLGKCVSMQKAARKRVKSDRYYPEVAESCIEQSQRRDRLASYTDWRKADKCAKREQARVVREEALKADKNRSDAAAEYLREAAKTERMRREERRR